MKRPPQVWVLFIIGVSCLFPGTQSLRATSLIFAKTTTTTAAPATEAPAVEASSSVSPGPETSQDANQTATHPPLTGIPQIDYIWDPNLPRELNGYNLTEYPFYERIPEEINFKCDGLHDGFYASVEHKCQVYHHCLFGTRFDFLCANFTAFDQKTFICHFASEVDCVNSPKFFHRNDALYEAASTTTVSTTTVQVVTAAPAPTPRRPSLAGRRRRPIRRRRPQYDYYYEDDEYDAERDDYYDDTRYQATTEAPRRRLKRPRPNRRPEYEEYDEYEDDRYRRPGRREEDRERRPYDRREDERRYDDRRKKTKYEDDMSEEERRVDDRRRPIDDEYERRPYDRRKPTRRPLDDDKDDRRSYERPRKEEDDRRYRPKTDAKVDDKPDKVTRRPVDDSAEKDDRRSYERPREEDDRRYRPKTDAKLDDKADKGSRRPVDDDVDDRRSYDRPRKSEDEDRRYRPKSDDKIEDRPRPKLDDERRYKPKDDRRSTEEPPKALIRPKSGSSVYDRPRAPPIIRRPVPKTERDKYDYKPMKAPSKVEDEEYYDDYEDEPVVKVVRKPEPVESEEQRSIGRRRPSNARKPAVESEEELPKGKRPVDRPRHEDRPAVKTRPADDQYEEYEDVKPKVETTTRSKFLARERERESTERKESHRSEPVVRVVKRPFLPSRGGNPFATRGLQPVGSKALDLSKVAPTKSEEMYDESVEVSAESKELADQKYTSSEEKKSDEDIKPVTVRARQDFRQTYRNDSPFRSTVEQRNTSPKPKVTDNYRNPLDINESEYDVTLNDALNPTLPNLPVRNVPSGFNTGRDSYQRPRIVNVDTPLLQASTEYIRAYVRPQHLQYQSANYRQPITGQYYNPY